MERVMTNMTPVQVGPGGVLIREGDVGDLFYVIVEGEVEVTSHGEHLGTLGPGAYVGEIALLRDVPRTATVVARTPLRLLALHREPFLLAVTGHPQSVQAAHAVADARMR
jgi:CRP-like cAMP-binding protein